jgi:hypothetical protein
MHDGQEHSVPRRGKRTKFYVNHDQTDDEASLRAAAITTTLLVPPAPVHARQQGGGKAGAHARRSAPVATEERET